MSSWLMIIRSYNLHVELEFFGRWCIYMMGELKIMIFFQFQVTIICSVFLSIYFQSMRCKNLASQFERK
jgi:hypothetical protein